MRAPNFLLVDYYNVGSGSVFEVAARYNNVTYDRTCCGKASSSDASTTARSVAAMIFGVLAAVMTVL